MHKLFLAFFLFLLSASLRAAINIQAEIAPSAIRIGEQAAINITVRSDKPVTLRLKTVSELNASKGYVEYLKLDTIPSQVDDAGRIESRFRYTVTSFEDSLYYIEPLSIYCQGREYQTNALSLKVESIPVDTTLLVGYGPKEVFKPYATWEEYGSNAWGPSLLLFALSALFLGLCSRFIHQKPLLKPTPKPEKPTPSHEEATNRLNKLKEKGLTDEAKRFYTALTDILRDYMQKRYRFAAREMTTSEIVRHLSTVNESGLTDEIRRIFQFADLVKFARQTDAASDRKQLIDFALGYVSKTKAEKEEVPESKKESTDENAGRKKSRRYIMAGLAAYAVVLLLLMSFVISQLYSILE